MEKILNFSILGFLALALSGCVVTQYQNEKGENCTRRYFTVCGISTHSCVKNSAAVEAMEQEIRAAERGTAGTKKDEGTEIKIAPSAPDTSASRSAAADAIRQNIRATERVR